jgi:putative endonuclease
VPLPWLKLVVTEKPRQQRGPGAKQKRGPGAKQRRGRAAERIGRVAEILCLVRLWLTGWRVLAHRLMGKRGSGLGEVDIVARRGRVLAFIEVKARRSEAEALESISATQRLRIQTAARAYLAHHPALADCHVRFDAMTVSGGFMPSHFSDAWRPE